MANTALNSTLGGNGLVPVNQNSQRSLSPSDDSSVQSDSSNQEVDPKTLDTRKRPFVCEHANCGKAYMKNSHLRAHHRTHTG